MLSCRTRAVTVRMDHARELHVELPPGLDLGTPDLGAEAPSGPGASRAPAERGLRCAHEHRHVARGSATAGDLPRAFEHPADRAATAALGRVPLLDGVVRKLIELGYEQALRQNLGAGALRIGPKQLGDAWADHVACYARLDLEPVPDLYLGQHPFANAAAIGSGKPVVLVNSGRSSCSTGTSCGRSSATRRDTCSPTTSCTGRRS